MANKKAETKSKITKKTSAKIKQISIKNHLKKNKRFLIVGIGFFLALSFILFFKGIFIAATVNGKPINRIVVVKELEKQNGNAVLESLITKELILQEAKKRNIEITQSDIEGEIKKIEESLKSQGTTLDQALQQQGMTRKKLDEEIRIQQLLQRMVAVSINITDEEIDKFIKDNKDFYPKGTSEEQLKNEAKTSLEQQKLQDKTQIFLEDLRKKAVIKNFVSY